MAELLSLATTLRDTRDEAADKIATAKEVKVAATSVNYGLDSIDSLIEDMLATRRRRKSDGETTEFPRPSTCSEFLSGLQMITDALTLDHANYNPAKALQVVNVLTTLSSEDLSCTATEVESLKAQVSTGKEKVTELIDQQTAIISEETVKYNEAVAEINALNAKLESMGANTLEAGVTVSTVREKAESASTTKLDGSTSYALPLKLTNKTGCCPKMTVVNSFDPELNGEYLLLAEEEKKRVEICVDGCVYSMGGDEFCFVVSHLGSVQCQA